MSPSRTLTLRRSRENRRGPAKRETPGGILTTKGTVGQSQRWKTTGSSPTYVLRHSQPRHCGVVSSRSHLLFITL